MKKHLRFIIFLSFSFIFLINPVYSQTSIQGVINKYSVVDSVYPTKDTVEVANPGLYNVGDTVMIYQAKGAVPLRDVPGNPQLTGYIYSSNVHNAGNYEIILIKEINGNQVVFKGALENDYDVDGLVQLIYIPFYKSVIVDGELTCDSWNGSTGGVLAIMVSDTMYLNANINVSGKGFRGAQPYQYTDVQSNCSFSDSVLYTSYYFSEFATGVSSGFKGEGIAEFESLYKKGRSKWATGGGGGNGRFSGGGGGGSGGSGGSGGAEDTTYCDTLATVWTDMGGKGGVDLTLINAFNDSTVFMGGGGGAGTYKSGFTATRGGNGGGVVILIVKNLKTSGRQITANGENVTGVATASAGGGGGGGVVVFDVDTIIGNLSIYSKGGQGGFVQTLGKSGPGGGGGGGVIFWNSIYPSNITEAKADKGKSGYIYPTEENPYYATPGGSGNAANFTYVKVPLTGFLFNTITENQQVCKGDIPDLLAGSNPRGGNGTFTYKWQSSLDNSSWSDIGGATERDFQPPAANDTIYYRRIVESAGIVDISYQIKIIVHDNIVNNQIFGDDLITCIGNEADTITGTEAIVSGGDYSTYNYIWQYSFDSSLWVTDVALNDTVYLHGIVTDTTFVRRIVQSGACYDTTNLTPSSKIIGLPPISHNTLSENQEICYGQIPEEIIGESPQDGLGVGSYSISWEERIEGSSTWNSIAGETGENLILPNLYETKYYRRIVESDDCEDISDELQVRVLPLIGNNTINNTNPVYTCYNTPAEILIGSDPTGGDNSYSYQWQDSILGGTWNNITNNSIARDYQSTALTDTTFFRRIVKSGLNDCCQDTTSATKIKIYNLPIGVIVDMDDTVCSGSEVNLNFNFSSGKIPYTLTYSDSETNFTPTAFGNANANITITPETDLESKIFDYTIVSIVDDNGCVATDQTGLAKITVYGNPVSNPGLDEETCLLTSQLDATPSLGTGIWSQVFGSGTTNFTNVNAANTNIEADLAGIYSYQWKEQNWQCKDSALVQIKLYEIPSNLIISPNDTTLFFISELDLRGKYENPDNIVPVSTLWQRITGTAGDFEDETDDTTKIVDLSDANNTGIIITWTVSKGVCEPQIDSIYIKLKEIFTPTGFTPNGDGVNDYLKFNGLENAASNELVIFNRLGTEVYRATNYSNDSGWDGKNMSGNDLPEDTYYYLLTVVDKEGASETHKGFIVIKRY